MWRRDACAGGETFIADAFAVARRLQLEDPLLFDSLLRHPVTFSKVHFERQYPASLHYRRPVIVVNQDGGAEPDIVSVNWSPQFEAPLHIDPSEAALFYRAYRCDMTRALAAAVPSILSHCPPPHQADVAAHGGGAAALPAAQRSAQPTPRYTAQPAC